MGKPFLIIDDRELQAFAKRCDANLPNAGKGIKRALEKLAASFLQDVKKRTPKKTGKLRDQWDVDNANIVVHEDAGGFYVYLVNTTEYAEWVEKGHYSYNQFGGPYEVKNRTVPYYDGNNAPTFVYGVFYLKKTEVEYNEGKLETIVSREFDKWLKDFFEKG